MLQTPEKIHTISTEIDSISVEIGREKIEKYNGKINNH
jgi:hypothetical protein